MRTTLTVVLALMAGATARAQDVEAGRKSFARCNGCHAAPDPSLRADRLWLTMVQTSA